MQCAQGRSAPRSTRGAESMRRLERECFFTRDRPCPTSRARARAPRRPRGGPRRRAASTRARDDLGHERGDTRRCQLSVAARLNEELALALSHHARHDLPAQAEDHGVERGHADESSPCRQRDPLRGRDGDAHPREAPGPHADRPALPHVAEEAPADAVEEHGDHDHQGLSVRVGHPPLVLSHERVPVEQRDRAERGRRIDRRQAHHT